MELRGLETFLKIVAEGTYSKAAIALGISQPAVSARMTALEQEVGQLLFERRGNLMVISAAGRRLLPYAEQAVQLIDDAVRATAHPADQRRETTIRLGANTAVAAGPLSRWLEPVINEWGDGGPRIDLHVDATPGLMQALFSGVVQLALVNPRLAAHQTTPLWSHVFPLALVASPDHPLAGRSITVQELVAERMITQEIGPSANQITAISTLLGTELDVVVRTNSADVIKRLVRRDVGIGLLPGPVVEEEIAAGTLVVIPIEDYSPEPWEVALVRWSDRWLPSSLAVFAERLSHQLETAEGVVSTESGLPQSQ
jgi:DNA-binding transcriptional LysR family regulator